MALENASVDADQEWLEEQGRMQMLENDFSLMEMIERNVGLVEPGDGDVIRRLLRADPSNNTQVSPFVIQALIKRYTHRVHDPSAVVRKHFEHLLTRAREYS